MKKILFISHEATLTGAPIVLYRFLKWLKENRKDISCTILLDYGGPLQVKLEALFPVIQYRKIVNYPAKLPHRIKASLNKRRQQKIINDIAKEQYDLVYSNTIINGPMLEKIKQVSTAKVIVHAHEMALTIEEQGDQNLLQNLTIADSLIANSNLVLSQLQALLKKAGISKRIDMVYPFAEMVDEVEKVIKKVRYTIGGSGSFAWRKGVEIFMYVAREVFGMRDDVDFVWVGGDQQSIEYRRFCYLAEKLNLQHRFSFIASTPEPFEHYKAFDLFFLSSLEEPFSLAAIECALLKVPLVCMKDCTGVAEILIPQGGLSFAAGDHKGIADGINDLLNNAEARQAMGKKAREIAIRHASVDLNAPKIMNLIDSCINNAGE